MNQEGDVDNISVHILATIGGLDHDYQTRRLAIAETYHQLSILATLRYNDTSEASLPLHLQAVARVINLKESH
jgi:hypothetical protein